MSLHVGSRWYRAPEISIIEKQYDQASDMWSFGCIIYELLQYLLYSQEHQHSFNHEQLQKKRYTFMGDSCFPLSPIAKQKNKKENESKQAISQND